MEYYGLHLGKSSIFSYGIRKDTPLTALAFFLGPPQTWTRRKIKSKESSIFRRTLEECPNLSSEQIVVHGCYLMNPASLREDVRRKSTPMFINELQICEEMNVGKYVFHPGCHKDSHVGLQYTVDMIKEGLRETRNIQILVENMTQSNRLCQTWEECKWVMDHVNDPRLGFCMDTAHCWGAGEKKRMFMDTLLDDFDRVLGIDHLSAIHLNDSKVAYGSNKDRHEDIGKGQIPSSFWKKFIFDPRVKRIPAILETPSNCHSVVTGIIQENTSLSESDSDSDSSSDDSDSSSDDSDSSSDDSDSSSDDSDTSSDDSDSSSDDSDSSSDDGLEKKSLCKKQQNIEDFFFSVPPKGSSDVTNIANTESKCAYQDLFSMLPKVWANVLADEKEKGYMQTLQENLVREQEDGYVIFPPISQTFRAFEYCSPDQIRVCIWGQDPYFRVGQAEGLSFSVPEGVPVPSSLRNIYKELEADIPAFHRPTHGSLVRWAEQGVFLLNSVLTVRSGSANSHKKFGWIQFTKAVIKYISSSCTGVVFLLWGKQAQKMEQLIDSSKHHVLMSAHPSGLSASRGFFGCRHFSRCNAILREQGLKEVEWQV